MRKFGYIVAGTLFGWLILGTAVGFGTSVMLGRIGAAPGDEQIVVGLVLVASMVAGGFLGAKVADNRAQPSSRPSGTLLGVDRYFTLADGSRQVAVNDFFGYCGSGRWATLSEGELSAGTCVQTVNQDRPERQSLVHYPGAQRSQYVKIDRADVISATIVDRRGGDCAVEVQTRSGHVVLAGPESQVQAAFEFLGAAVVDPTNRQIASYGVQPGWYPDPDDPRWIYYWDGAGWDESAGRQPNR